MDEELTFAELLADRQLSGKQASTRRRKVEEQESDQDLPERQSTLSGKHKPVLVTESKADKARARFHRENKNRPTEVTAKRAVARHRDVLQAGTGWAHLLGSQELSVQALQALISRCRSIRDPRFDDTSGKLDSRAFAKRYGFVYDEVMAGEAADLKAALKVHPACCTSDAADRSR